MADTEKLSQIVTFLAEVRTILDGGWHYSSPLIRAHDLANSGGCIIERPDALGIVADVVADIDLVSSSLFGMATRATELGIDTVTLCGADLGLLARVYQQLAQDISNAANRAVDTLSPAAKPERKRAPRTPKASPSSSLNQGSLPMPAMPAGMQSGEAFDSEVTP